MFTVQQIDAQRVGKDFRELLANLGGGEGDDAETGFIPFVVGIVQLPAARLIFSHQLLLNITQLQSSGFIDGVKGGFPKEFHIDGTGLLGHFVFDLFQCVLADRKRFVHKIPIQHQRRIVAMVVSILPVQAAASGLGYQSGNADSLQFIDDQSSQSFHPDGNHQVCVFLLFVVFFGADKAIHPAFHHKPGYCRQLLGRIVRDELCHFHIVFTEVGAIAIHIADVVEIGIVYDIVVVVVLRRKSLHIRSLYQQFEVFHMLLLVDV